MSSNWLALSTVVVFTVLSLSRSVALFRGVCKDTHLFLQSVVLRPLPNTTIFFPSVGYHAPLDLYPEFHRIAKDPILHSVPEGRPVSVCVGKEWYRFPSSFLLPNKSESRISSDINLHSFLANWLLYFSFSSWQLHFIQSEFKGQLPQPYAPGPLATQVIPAHMNDQNLEEPTRYVSCSNRLAC